MPVRSRLLKRLAALSFAAAPHLALPADAAVVLSADFNVDAGPFAYLDDAFRATAQPAYASGTRLAAGGRTGGALEVRAGGVDAVLVTNGMSGGWRASFTLAAASDVAITFAYRLNADASYEDDEVSDVLVALDGVLQGAAPGIDYVRRVASGGDAGWQTFTFTRAALPAGTHTLTVGAWNNRKSEPAELTVLTLDDVKVETVVLPAETIHVQDPGPDGLVSIEAERFSAKAAQGGKDWIPAAIAGASGGSALECSPNSGANVNTGYVTASPRLDWRVRFVKTGTHYLWTRGIGRSGDDDSWHAGIDGAATTTLDRIQGFGTAWTWTRSDMDGGLANFNVASAGLRTVNGWMREDGLIIDKVVITTNPYYVPTGTGPEESPRTAGNLPPVADAGPSFLTLTGKQVRLDGSRSVDPDNAPAALAYAWTQTGGPAVTLALPNTARPAFTPAAAGTYAFRLAVSDGRHSDLATVTVTVKAPEAGMVDVAQASYSHDAQAFNHARFPEGLWDGHPGEFGLINYTNAPVNVTFSFPKAVTVSGAGIVQSDEGWFSLAAAASLADLEARSGSYRVLVNQHGTVSDAWSRAAFAAAAFQHFRLTVVRTGNDGFVHLQELELTGPNRFELAPFVSPRGLAVDRYGRKLVADEGRRSIILVDSLGACLGEFGAGSLAGPVDVAVAPDGNVLVADYLGDRVVRFRPDGSFLNEFVGAGSVRGRVSRPTGIALDAFGRVLVSEEATRRVQRFLPSGAPDATFGTSGVLGTGLKTRANNGFDRPMDVFWDAPRRRVVVADAGSHPIDGNNRIQVFGENGNHVRTVNGLYDLRSVAVAADGTLYAAGGVTYHNGYMGALRIMAPNDEFAVKTYRNGTAGLGAVTAGVALDNAGRVVFTDATRRQIHHHEPGRQGDLYEVKAKSGPTWIEITYKTHAAATGGAVWGRSGLSAQVNGAANLRTHTIRVNGLQPSTEYRIAPIYPRSMDGARVTGPTYVVTTEPASAGTLNVARVRTAAVLYTYGMDDEEKARIRRIFENVRQFYFRNSYGRLWLDMRVVEVTSPLLESDVDAFGPSPERIERDLAPHGFGPSNPPQLVVVQYEQHGKGNFGGGGTFFGHDAGFARHSNRDHFVAIHEVNHAVDHMFAMSGNERYHSNHGLWHVEWADINGRDGTVNGHILRMLSPVEFPALAPAYATLHAAADADGDGLSSDAALPFHEGALGANPNDADSDDDGLTDLQEMMRGIHHASRASVQDGDGDGSAQGNDLKDRNPLVAVNGYVAKATPSLDGVFSPSEGWTLVMDGVNFRNDFCIRSPFEGSTDKQEHPATKVWSAWDADGVYFAVEFTSRPWKVDMVNFNADLNSDGWYNGLDNHILDFNMNGIRRNDVTGITQDLSNMLGEGGWGEISDESEEWARLGLAPLYNRADARFSLANLGGDRYYAEFRLPAGARRAFAPASGKTVHFKVSHETQWAVFDDLLELDTGARLLLVDRVDTDGDGKWDQQEREIGTNPTVRD